MLRHYSSQADDRVMISGAKEYVRSLKKGRLEDRVDSPYNFEEHLKKERDARERRKAA